MRCRAAEQAEPRDGARAGRLGRRAGIRLAGHFPGIEPGARLPRWSARRGASSATACSRGCRPRFRAPLRRRTAHRARAGRRPRRFPHRSALHGTTRDYDRAVDPVLEAGVAEHERVAVDPTGCACCACAATHSALLLPICAYFYAFAPRARQASRAYLRRVLAAPVGSAQVFRHFHVFASTLLDRIEMLSQGSARFDIQVHGLDAVEGFLAQGRGCLLLGSHLGSGRSCALSASGTRSWRST
jgi:hypothetical protein